MDIEDGKTYQIQANMMFRKLSLRAHRKLFFLFFCFIFLIKSVLEKYVKKLCKYFPFVFGG